MLKAIQKIIDRFGLLYTIEFSLAIASLIAITIFILQIALPTEQMSFDLQTTNSIPSNSTESLINNSQNDTDLHRILTLAKSGMFKSASGLNNKPMADKTIERIRSQLKLQCIMKMSGKPTAYINIKNIGLKKCTVGEKVCDMFTVTSINEKSVEVSIIEHRVLLTL